MPINPDHTKYLCFVWNGRVYQFKVLCFGIKHAPFTFNRLGLQLKKFFNRNGVSIIIYIDDILVISDTFHKCLKDAQFVINKLVELGLHIKLEKCSLHPNQSFFFLGFLWDTNTMTCQLPEEKLTSIKSLGEEVLSQERVTVKTLQRLLGRIISTRPAVQMSRARSRGIQRLILDNYRDRSSAKKQVRLTAWAREDINWWRNLPITECNMSLKSIPVWQSLRLATDAMDTAIGSVFLGEEFYEVLDSKVARQTIAHKEWIAFSRTVLPNLEVLRNAVVSWHVDNMNVRQAWLNSGTIKDKWLCREVVNMQILLYNQNTKIVPVYIRSAQHLHADFVSRNRALPDWHLSEKVARRLFQVVGFPQVDLMATNKSKQVHHYYAPLLDEEALAIDAFTEDWDRFQLSYIFPQPPMIELVLNRIHQCSRNSRFILITPWRIGAVWFNKALKLATQLPIRLPVSWNTVVDLGESDHPPVSNKGAKMRFVAWQLSGQEGLKLEDCPLGLNKLYSRAGRRILKNHMDWASGTGPSTVETTNWTSLQRLL